MIAGRLLLEYGGEGYENRTMQMSKPDWLAYKTSLGFDFPNFLTGCFNGLNMTGYYSLGYSF